MSYRPNLVSSVLRVRPQPTEAPQILEGDGSGASCGMKRIPLAATGCKTRVSRRPSPAHGMRRADQPCPYGERDDLSPHPNVARCVSGHRPCLPEPARQRPRQHRSRRPLARLRLAYAPLTSSSTSAGSWFRWAATSRCQAQGGRGRGGTQPPRELYPV
jgi:hypothetical protein